jgi:hypothetical protein
VFSKTTPTKFSRVVFGVFPKRPLKRRGPRFPKRGLGRFGGRLAQTGWGRYGGRSAERPSEWVRGRFRKRPPVVFGVVKAVIRIGWIEEAAARFYFRRHIQMAPKDNSPVKTAGIFEPGQISIDVTVTSPVSLPTIRCAEHKIWIKARDGRRRPLPRSTIQG